MILILCLWQFNVIESESENCSVSPTLHGHNTGVGSLHLLQGIFLIQELNPGLPHCRWILYQLSHKGSPRILECVAYSFSRGSSRPRNWMRVSCIADEFFTNWAIGEVPKVIETFLICSVYYFIHCNSSIWLNWKITMLY